MSIFNRLNNHSTAEVTDAKTFKTESKFETFSRFRNDIRNMTEDFKRFFRDVYLEESEINIRANNVDEISMQVFYARVTALWEALCRDRVENLKAEGKDHHAQMIQSVLNENSEL